MNKKQLGLVSLWLAVLSVFGLQISMLIPISLGVPTTPFSIAFKGICLLLAIFLLVVSIPFLKRSHLSKASIALIIFIVIYSIRFVYDISIRQLHITSSWYLGDYDASYFYLYGFGACFIPAIAIVLNGRFIDLQIAVKLITLLSVIQIFCISFCIMKALNFTITSKVMSERHYFIMAMLDEKGGNPLNPITAARYAAINVSLIAYIFIFNFINIVKINRYVLVASAVLSLGIIIISGSRGPLVALILSITLILVYYIKSRKKDARFYLKAIFYPPLFFSISLFIAKSMSTLDFSLVKRTTTFFEERELGIKETRDYQWESAINQFLSSPIIGDKIFENYEGYYPHNTLLEAFMSTGIFGGCLYLYVLLSAGSIGLSIFFLKRKTPVVILIVYFINLIISFTSGNLFENVEFYASASLLVSINLHKTT